MFYRLSSVSTAKHSEQRYACPSISGKVLPVLRQRVGVSRSPQPSQVVFEGVAPREEQRKQISASRMSSWSYGSSHKTQISQGACSVSGQPPVQEG